MGGEEANRMATDTFVPNIGSTAHITHTYASDNTFISFDVKIDCFAIDI